MLRTRKRFCQRIWNIQIRVYFTYLDLTLFEELLNKVESPHDMFAFLVIPRLLCLRNSPTVVTVKIQRAGCIWKHTKLNKELPYLNTFLRSFWSCDVLGFCCRISRGLLLGTLPAYCTTIYCEHVTWLGLWIIFVSLETSSCVTYYNELILTSID